MHLSTFTLGKHTQKKKTVWSIHYATKAIVCILTKIKWRWWRKKEDMMTHIRCIYWTTPHQSFLKHSKRINYWMVCDATWIITSEDSEECLMTAHCHHCHMPVNVKHSLVHILATMGIHCLFRAPAFPHRHCLKGSLWQQSARDARKCWCLLVFQQCGVTEYTEWGQIKRH